MHGRVNLARARYLNRARTIYGMRGSMGGAAGYKDFTIPGTEKRLDIRADSRSIWLWTSPERSGLDAH